MHQPTFAAGRAKVTKKLLLNASCFPLPFITLKFLSRQRQTWLRKRKGVWI